MAKTFKLSADAIAARRIAHAGKMSVLKSKQQHAARKGDKQLHRRMWNEELLAY